MKFTLAVVVTILISVSAKQNNNNLSELCSKSFCQCPNAGKTVECICELPDQASIGYCATHCSLDCIQDVYMLHVCTWWQDSFWCLSKKKIFIEWAVRSFLSSLSNITDLGKKSSSSDLSKRKYLRLISASSAFNKLWHFVTLIYYCKPNY